MAGDSGSGGAASAGRAKALNDKRRKKPVGGKAGIPFANAFRTQRGQASANTRANKRKTGRGTTGLGRGIFS